ncbi:S-layer homology domain-containing protein [Jeotgalibacillus malaysiensis]|uniref:S-layer homology domain-containing protein n=1 Tax=Jeotgalibacillus malaysiensis TaxID=1508404 RepID=UPI0038515CFF
MKKLFSTVFVAAGMLAFSAEADAFSDVQLYKSEIDFLTNEGIISGYNNGTFKPTEGLTRLQAVQMLVREMGDDVLNPGNPGFSDVQPGDYGYGDVAKAVELGLISGKTDKNGEQYFDPYAPMTRAQMAKVLSEGYGLFDTQNISFIDVNMLHWANEYVNSLASNDVTTGFGDGTYRPEDHIARQHFAVFMARLLEDNFKPELPEVSFMPDEANTYVYQTDQFGNHFSTFSHVSGDTWLEKSETTDGYVLEAERPFIETSNGVAYSEPTLVFSFAFGYPVKEGHSWIDPHAERFTITDTIATVSTKAGTFNNAVEVRGLNRVDYYVPDIGLVKSTWINNGEEHLRVELVEVK